jgi:hypothetical protein
MINQRLIGIIIFALLFCACNKKSESRVFKENKLQTYITEEKRLADKKGKDEYLHLAQLATLLFYNHNHKEAAKYFEKAFKWKDANYTKSISRIALAKILNDRVSVFRGHYLERYHFRLLAVFNFLILQKKESALVELRRLSREVRLDKDIFNEKRTKSSIQQYLSLTGLLFILLNKNNEGFSDLKYAYKIDKEKFPKYLKHEYELYLKEVNSDEKITGSKLFRKKSNIKIDINLNHLRNKLVSNKIKLTMFEYWPIVQTEVEGHKSYHEIEDVFLGTFGKRVMAVSFPTPKIQSILVKNNNDYLNFNKEFNESWQLQKGRLLRSSLVRIALKIVASNTVANLIDSQSDSPWAEILANIGRTVVWETERADTRVIQFLPSLIKINWEWHDKKQDVYNINWEGVFKK